MSNNDMIVSLDIGTSKVRAMIGEINEGAIHIVGVGSADTVGVRKGAIVDIDQTVQSIRNAIEHAERMVGIQIHEVYVGITGAHIGLLNSHGVVAVSNEDREIGEVDIDRVIQAAKVVAMPPEREMIDTVPKQFLVDGLEEITDPRGMIGVRLEVEATIITGAKTSIHNLMKCVTRAGLEPKGLILTPLAAGDIALSRDDKMIGTALVDMGAGATTIGIYHEGHLVASSVLPIGGDLMTNDIAIGFKTQSEHAEQLKLKYGCSRIGDADETQTFSVPRIGGKEEKTFSQKDLAMILEPRVQEMLEMVREEVERWGYRELEGGYVFVGGTVNLPGFQQAAQTELGATVRIAIPDFIGVKDPSFAIGTGIIQYVYKKRPNRDSSSSKMKKPKSASQNSNAESLWQRFKNWLNDFI